MRGTLVTMVIITIIRTGTVTVNNSTHRAVWPGVFYAMALMWHRKVEDNLKRRNPGKKALHSSCL